MSTVILPVHVYMYSICPTYTRATTEESNAIQLELYDKCGCEKVEYTILLVALELL